MTNQRVMNKRPAKNRPKSIHYQIVETLGREIVTGVFPVGSQIPTESILAESLGVGRLALREAMKVLASMGMVVILPKTGTHVLPRESWNLFDPNVLQWHVQYAFDEEFTKDLVELRNMIEPVAAGIAATQATPEQIEKIQQAYVDMVQAETHADYLEADLRFHGAVLSSCKNRFIRQLQAPISEVLKVSFKASSTPGRDADREHALILHQALLIAIENHDPSAAKSAVERLIERASERMQHMRS